MQPSARRKVAIDVMDVVEDVAARGIKMPVLIRFQDILRRRVALINEAFATAISENGYTGRYSASIRSSQTSCARSSRRSATRAAPTSTASRRAPRASWSRCWP